MYVPSELKVLQTPPGTAVVEVLGEHDLSTRDETAALFARLVAENELVVVDLSEAVHRLVVSEQPRQGKARCREHEHTLLLQVGTDPEVRRMLEITNFLDHFDHVSSRDEALAWAPR